MFSPKIFGQWALTPYNYTCTILNQSLFTLQVHGMYDHSCWDSTLSPSYATQEEELTLCLLAVVVTWQRRLDTVFCAPDYALCLIRIITFLTSPASFPSQYGLGPRVNVNYQREVELQLEDRSMLKVGKASSWSTGSISSLPSCAADPSRGHTAYVTQGLNGVDSVAYLESSLLELSNDVKFVEILVNTTENTIRYSKPPYIFAYACRSHDCVQSPLVTWVYQGFQRITKGISSTAKGTVYPSKKCVVRRLMHVQMVHIPAHFSLLPCMWPGNEAMTLTEKQPLCHSYILVGMSG